MSRPDVLGAIDAAARDLDGKLWQDLIEARAAVSELIAAVLAGEIRKADTGEEYVRFGVVATARLRAALATCEALP